MDDIRGRELGNFLKMDEHDCRTRFFSKKMDDENVAPLRAYRMWFWTISPHKRPQVSEHECRLNLVHLIQK